MQKHRYRKSRIPKESKTTPIFGDPIKGDGLDFGIYYKCWNCGFVCNADRDALGTAESRDGVNLVEFIEVPERHGQGASSSLAVLGGSVNHFQVAMESGLDGNPKGISHSLMAKDGSGCPLCGTLNWRGDY